MGSETNGKRDPYFLSVGAFHIQQAIIRTLASYLIHNNPAYDPTHDLRFVVPLFVEKHDGISDDIISAVRVSQPMLCKWYQTIREDLDEFPEYSEVVELYNVAAQLYDEVKLCLAW